MYNYECRNILNRGKIKRQRRDTNKGKIHVMKDWSKRRMCKIHTIENK